MNTSVSISGINYVLGRLSDIKDLDFLQNDLEKLNFYYTAGLKSYSNSEKTFLEMAEETALETIKNGRVDKSKIQYLVLVSENFGREYIPNTRDINFLIQNLGIPNAFPVGISLSDCANVTTGIGIAFNFVKSGSAENVLLISIDKLSAKNSRIMNPEMSVLSDAAVSCIISNSNEGDFIIEGVFQKNMAEQWFIDREENQKEYSLNKFKTLVDIKKQVTNASVKPEEFRYLITSNYLKHISKMFMQICGFKESQSYFNNIPKFGHTLAGDVLINLKDLNDEVELFSGDRLMLMADSYSACSAVSLVKV